MYLSIIILPLLGSIVAGFFGRKVGVRGAQIITCSCVIVTTILALLAWVEVGFNNIPVTIDLFRWIDSEWFNITWGFQFDSLTVSMLIPVLIISSLVHIYSIGYMSSDPHNQRFFSYLSLFTFMMIILVTGNNYLLMFVGWEGNLKCLKWASLSNFDECSVMVVSLFGCAQRRFFFSRNFKSTERIGPHNLNILSLIIGSLLCNSYLENRGNGLLGGIRVVFVICSNNMEYLRWFHLMMANAGYCSYTKPKVSKLIGKKNKVLFITCFKSYSFSSFMWLFNMFYTYSSEQCAVKIIPRNLGKYITPLVLTTWFLFSTFKSDSQAALLSKKSLFGTSLSSRGDLNYLALILHKRYNINTVIEFSNTNYLYKGGSLNISNTTVFSKLVKPHLLSSQYYLLNKPTLKLNLFGVYPSKRNLSTKNELTTINSTNEYKKQYKLSLEQREALIGIILGDGFLERAKSTHNTRLQIEQSYPEKEQYVLSLYNLLEPLVTKSPVILTRNDKRNNSVTQSLRFRTSAMPCLNYYHDLFYKDRVKSIPRNLEDLLTARGLAFWIMDDGGKSVYNQTILHTRSFKLEDVKYIQSVLLKNFDLNTRLEEKKKDQWVIYIPVRQKIKLKDIVGPFMHESMLYKI